MKTIKYIPEICKADGSKWSGHVVLRCQSFDEKCDMMTKLGMKIERNGSITFADDDALKMIREMVNVSKDLYVEVDLKHVDGEEIKSFDDMQYVSGLHEVMAEVARFVMDGFKVGNG